MHIDTKNIIQICCLPLALFTNGFLMFLICTKSPSELGTYKYLMIFFAVSSICYSFVEAFISPLAISYEDFFLVVSKIKLPEPNIDRYILYYGSGSCAVIMTIVVIHFVYRYFAIERRGNLKYFAKWYFPCWLLIPVVTCLVWGTSAAKYLAKDEDSSEYISELLLQEYGLNVSDVVYMGVSYWKTGQNGKKYQNWEGIDGVCILGGMNICFVFIFVLGTKTYKKIKVLLDHGTSDFAKKLQKQLYYALVIQTIIPVFFMIIPVSVFFFTPLFHLGHAVIADIATMSVMIYPVLDPFPVIFIVDNYRNAVLKLFGVSRG